MRTCARHSHADCSARGAGGRWSCRHGDRARGGSRSLRAKPSGRRHRSIDDGDGSGADGRSGNWRRNCRHSELARDLWIGLHRRHRGDRRGRCPVPGVAPARAQNGSCGRYAARLCPVVGLAAIRGACSVSGILFDDLLLVHLGRPVRDGGAAAPTRHGVRPLLHAGCRRIHAGQLRVGTPDRALLDPVADDRRHADRARRACSSPSRLRPRANSSR